MEERFDRLEGKIDALITTVDQKLAGIDEKFVDVRQELAGVSQKLDDLSERVGVLHEDVKSDFRFSLEARQALKEVMETGFANQERSFREALAPIADPVRIRRG